MPAMSPQGEFLSEISNMNSEIVLLCSFASSRESYS